MSIFLLLTTSISFDKANDSINKIIMTAAQGELGIIVPHLAKTLHKCLRNSAFTTCLNYLKMGRYLNWKLRHVCWTAFTMSSTYILGVNDFWYIWMSPGLWRRSVQKAEVIFNPPSNSFSSKYNNAGKIADYMYGANVK